MIISFMFATRQMLSMLIFCKIFVELEHFIIFKNIDKCHNFTYYRINNK